MKPLSPAQSLVLLCLAGAAFGGFSYGLHWKRVASGDLFTSDERTMIRLQDQIEALIREKEALQRRVRELNGEPEPAPAAGSTGSGIILNPDDAEVVLPTSRPVLPAPPQKAETH